MTNRISLQNLPIINRREQMFWTLLSVASIFLVLYMILIQSAIYNIVVEKQIAKEYRITQSDMLAYEEVFLEKSKEVSLDTLANFGLVNLSKNDVHYVKAEIGSGLTLNMDGR